MRIDRLIAYSPENLPFIAVAVGMDNIERIEQQGDMFVVYDDNGDKVYEILDFHNITITFTKGE